jgi:hypothetical protein
MSEAWRDATAMMSANREVLLIVAGIFFFLPGVVLALAMGDVQDTMIANPEEAQQMMLTFYGDWWWLLLAYFVVTIVGTLAMLALLRDHTRPTVAEALRVGLVGALPAIAASIVLGTAIALAAIMLLGAAGLTGSGVLVALTMIVVAAGFAYVYVKFSLSAAVIAIEKVYNPFAVIARSWRLTKGNSVRLFMFYLLLFIVYFVVSAVLAMIIKALTLAIGEAGALMAEAIVTGLLGAAFSIVFVAVLAASHRQLSGPSAAAVSETFE